MWPAAVAGVPAPPWGPSARFSLQGTGGSHQHCPLYGCSAPSVFAWQEPRPCEKLTAQPPPTPRQWPALEKMQTPSTHSSHHAAAGPLPECPSTAQAGSGPHDVTFHLMARMCGYWQFLRTMYVSFQFPSQEGFLGQTPWPHACSHTGCPPHTALLVTPAQKPATATPTGLPPSAVVPSAANSHNPVPAAHLLCCSRPPRGTKNTQAAADLQEPAGSPVLPPQSVQGRTQTSLSPLTRLSARLAFPSQISGTAPDLPVRSLPPVTLPRYPGPSHHFHGWSGIHTASAFQHVRI